MSLNLDGQWKCKINDTDQRRAKIGDNVIWRATDRLSTLDGQSTQPAKTFDDTLTATGTTGTNESTVVVPGDAKSVSGNAELAISGNSIQQEVPEGYTQLKDIQSTSGGKQMTTIPVYADSTDTQTICRFRILGQKDYGYVFGHQSVTTGYWALRLIANTLELQILYSKAIINTGIYATLGTTYTLTMTAKNDVLTWDINGTSGTYTTSNTYTSDKYIGICNGVGMTYYGYNAIEYFYTRVGTEEYECIPAKRTSDSAIGLYDKSHDTIYTSATDTAFVAGDTAVPTPDEPISIQSVGDRIYDVPDSYDVLEYVESTGTQYIDTGYVLTGNIDYEMKIKADSSYTSSSYKAFFGCRNTGGSDNRLVLSYNTSSGVLAINHGTIDSASSFTDTNSFLETIVKKSENTYTFTNSNGTATHTVSVDTGSNNINMLLFSMMNNDSTPYYCACGYMYYCKIWDNNTLVRNFIPAMRKSDSVVGMYDTVTQTFFENAGTGSFTAGDVVKSYRIQAVDKSKNLFEDVIENANLESNGEIQAHTGCSEWIAKVESGKSYTITGSTGAQITLGYFDEKPMIGSTTYDGTRTVFSPTSSYLTFTATYTGYAVIRSLLSETEVMITEGTTATTYEPYFEPKYFTTYLDAPLRKVGTYCDTIVGDTLTRNVCTETIQCLGNSTSGSKYWSYTTSTSVWISNDYFSDTASAGTTLLCKYFPCMFATATADMKDGYIGIYTGSSVSTYGKRLYLKDTINAPTAYDDFKAWVDSLGAELVYPLSTPTTETIVWEEQSSAEIGTNVFDMTTEISPSAFTVSQDYIKEVEHSTPDPEHSLEILSCGDECNPSGIPDEYDELEFIESTGTQYIISGVSSAETLVIQTTIGKNTELLSGDNGIFGSGGAFGARWAALDTIRCGFGTSSWQSTAITQNDINTIYFSKAKSTFNDTEIGVATGDRYGEPIYLFTNGTNKSITRMYSFSIADSDTLVRNMIPARRKSDNVVGMYDLCTSTFFTNAGTGVFTPGDVVKKYAITAVDNGVNLLKNSLTSNDGTAIGTSRCTAAILNGKIVLTATAADICLGVLKQAGNAYVSACGWLCSVKPNTTYTWHITNGLFTKNYLSFYNASKVSIGHTSGNSSITFTTASDCYYMSARPGYANSVAGESYEFNMQLEEGSTATDIVPYHSPQTYVAYLDEPLRKVGDYKDEISVTRATDGWISTVTRNVGSKTLNGTESSWSVQSNVNYSITKTELGSSSTVLPYGSKDVLVTRFAEGEETVIGKFWIGGSYVNFDYDKAEGGLDNFKSWLASNNMECIFPLAKPTTETVEWVTTESEAVPHVLDGENIEFTTSVQPSSWEVV